MLFLVFSCLHAQAEISVEDSAGRTVKLSAPAKRIVLTDALALLALNLVTAKPSRLLAGWSSTRLDRSTYERFRRADPQLADIIDLGNVGPASFPLESIIGLKPDLVVVTPYVGRNNPSVFKLQAAGISVAIFQFSSSQEDPVGSRAVAALAYLIGNPDRMGGFDTFAETRLKAIEARLSSPSGLAMPLVLMEAHAGSGPCCTVPGRTDSMAHLIELAGGINLGSSVVNGFAGTISPEYILTHQPKVYIGTGGEYLRARGGLVLGTDVAPTEASTSLMKVTDRTAIKELSAVQTGRTVGIWHQLAAGPLAIVALEVIAKSLHPELFADLDPQATLDEINARFAFVPLKGTFWVNDHPSRKQLP